MSSSYRTLRTLHRFEIDKIKGSRFIAFLFPCPGESAVMQQIEACRAEFPEANHHCWAWRANEAFRYSDDGEPSGTAGRPILQQLEGNELNFVGAIVTRLFGGTKLGAGGLMRAYAQACREAIESAPLAVIRPMTQVRVAYDYSLSGAVEGLLNRYQPLRDDSAFESAVTLTLRLAPEQAVAFIAEFSEVTAGRGEVLSSTPSHAHDGEY